MDERITLNEFVNALRFELGANGDKKITSIGITMRNYTGYLVSLDEGNHKESDIVIPMYKEDYYKKYELLNQ
jgi:hypothetical protein